MKFLFIVLSASALVGCNPPSLKVTPGAPRTYGDPPKAAPDPYAAPKAPEAPEETSIFHKEEGYKRFMSQPPAGEGGVPKSTFQPGSPIGGDRPIGSTPYVETKPWAGDYGQPKPNAGSFSGSVGD